MPGSVLWKQITFCPGDCEAFIWRSAVVYMLTPISEYNDYSKVTTLGGAENVNKCMWLCTYGIMLGLRYLWVKEKLNLWLSGTCIVFNSLIIIKIIETYPVRDIAFQLLLGFRHHSATSRFAQPVFGISVCEVFTLSIQPMRCPFNSLTVINCWKSQTSCSWGKKKRKS